jgi:hypothetical protein
MADARFANIPSEPHRIGGFDQRPIFAGMPTLTAAAATRGSPELKIQTETPVVSHEEIFAA